MFDASRARYRQRGHSIFFSAVWAQPGPGGLPSTYPRPSPFVKLRFMRQIIFFNFENIQFDA